MNFKNNNSKEKNCNDPECELVRLGIKHRISEHRNIKPNSGWPDYFEPALCTDLTCFKNRKDKDHFEDECGKFLENEGTKGQNCIVCFLTTFGVLSFIVSIALGIVFVSVVEGERFNEFFAYSSLFGVALSLGFIVPSFFLYKKWNLLWEPFPTWDFTYEEWIEVHSHPITYKFWRFFLWLIIGYGILLVSLLVWSIILTLITY